MEENNLLETVQEETKEVNNEVKPIKGFTVTLMSNGTFSISDAQKTYNYEYPISTEEITLLASTASKYLERSAMIDEIISHLRENMFKS